MEDIEAEVLKVEARNPANYLEENSDLFKQIMAHVSLGYGEASAVGVDKHTNRRSVYSTKTDTPVTHTIESPTDEAGFQDLRYIQRNLEEGEENE